MSLQNLILLVCALPLILAQPVVVLIEPEFSAPSQITTAATDIGVNVSEVRDMVQSGQRSNIIVPTYTSKFVEITLCPDANSDGTANLILSGVGDAESGSTLYGCTNLTSCDVQHHFCADASGARVNMCSGKAVLNSDGVYGRLYGFGEYGSVSNIEFSYRMDNEAAAKKRKSSKKVALGDIPKSEAVRLNLCQSIAKIYDGQTLQFTAVLSAYQWSYPDYAVDVLVSTDPLAQNLIASNSDGAHRVAFVYVAAKMPQIYVTIRNTGSAPMTVSLTGSFQTS